MPKTQEQKDKAARAAKLKRKAIREIILISIYEHKPMTTQEATDKYYYDRARDAPRVPSGTRKNPKWLRKPRDDRYDYKLLRETDNKRRKARRTAISETLASLHPMQKSDFVRRLDRHREELKLHVKKRKPRPQSKQKAK